MANHKSALKRLRQNQVIRQRNASTRTACRTAVKKALAVISAGDRVAAAAAVRNAEKMLATAASKGIYHKANVSRRVSRLAVRLSAMQ